MSINITFRNYVLDPFQIQAITEIEQGNSLVVSAPTGSGKTLVAEYLIEKMLQTSRRIVYTSPIKALSNQKYRDFSRLYGDKIGILTGDVVVNRDAQVLIMTTEVYRNMVVEDPEAVKDVAYVIFDEIHFLGDIERGTVWEESIIFSPKTVRILALSATIPNCEELARWIESVLDHRVGVISHNQRVVPLAFLYYHQNALVPYKELVRRVSKREQAEFEDGGRRNRKGKEEESRRHLDIIRTLRSQDRLPALYFVFSRALADHLSQETARIIDFTSTEEKAYIDEQADACFAKYGIADLESAQAMKDMLRRGVGKHHAGILPQLKELVEVLFAERLLRVLFVTETFAVGVNMPARTVVFDALKKFDGRSFRVMKTLEFFQISGRAGRRGIDPQGWVVVPYLPRDLDLKDMETLVYGDVEPLLSQFDLSFNSVLNLFAGHKSDEIRTILKRNFAQFQANKELPKLADMVARLRAEIDDLYPRCVQKKNDLDVYTAFHRKKQDMMNSWHRQLDATFQGLRGRKSRVVRQAMQQKFQAKMAELEEEERRYICGNCPNRGKCTSRIYKIFKVDKKLDYWRGLLEQQEELQLPLYEEKLGILRELGYIDDKSLLARGVFASRIHVEELAVTELYFKGVFHEWDHHEINALAHALTFERRRGVEAAPPPKGQALNRLREARGFVNSLARRIKYVKQLDITLAMVMHAWSKGADLEQIASMTNQSEGDMIRSFRQAIDLLRQIREATDDKSLREKLTDCVYLINRDIVLATELRD